MLTKDQVQKVAKLANLKLSEVEEEKYSKELSKILDYIDQLEQVKTSDEPTFYVSVQKSVSREDKISDSLTQDQALANASNAKNGFFVTKGVFEDE